MIEEAAAKRHDLFTLIQKRRVIMGILNITPDSFSDGGRYFQKKDAQQQAKLLHDQGADILDIGAESTRPGHIPLSAKEEWRRLDLILPTLIETIPATFSIDTYKAFIAQKALSLGVSIVNDVWGLQKDPAMADLVAEAHAGIVIMHNRPSIDAEIDILADMEAFFDRSLAIAAKAGIPSANILLDPGIGFGKTTQQNLIALRACRHFKQHYSLPILVGVSRKSLFKDLLGAPVDDRIVPTIAANLAAVAFGAQVLRVHDVGEHLAALKIFEEIYEN